MAHTFNPITQEAEQSDSEFEAILVYRRSSKTAWRKLVSKNLRGGGMAFPHSGLRVYLFGSYATASQKEMAASAEPLVPLSQVLQGAFIERGILGVRAE